MCSGVKWVFLFNVRTSLIDIPFDLYDRPICQPRHVSVSVGRAHLYRSNAILPATIPGILPHLTRHATTKITRYGLYLLDNES